MMSGVASYLGFGRSDRCPSCGADTANADDDGVRICLACGDTHRRDEEGKLEPRHHAYVPFSSGRRISVAVIRNELTDLPVAVLADLARLPEERFLTELDDWARGIGLPYGVEIDTEAGTIAVAYRGVVAR